MLASKQIVRDGLGGKAEVASKTVKADAKMITKQKPSHSESVKPNTGLYSIVVRKDQAVELGMVTKNGRIIQIV